MYVQFVKSTLQEYYKIISTIESCKNPVQAETAQRMCLVFANNCEFRLEQLKRYRRSHLFNADARRNVNNYNELVTDQLEVIGETMKAWYDLYNEYMQEEDRKDEEKKTQPKKPKPIKGFNKLFK